jgi:hypothetical protein
MTEKTANARKPFEGKIPDETREYFHAAREEFHKSIEGFFPPEFREHHRNARKEMMLAWRSMLDASLEKMDKEK